MTSLDPPIFLHTPPQRNATSQIRYTLRYYALQAVISGKLTIIPTISEKLDLSDKNVSSIWIRTLCDLYIKELNIARNPIRIVPDIFSLEILNCNQCQIREMPTYMPDLKILNCSDNYIRKLPIYPSLAHLNCSGNPIIDLSQYIKRPNIEIIANNCPILTKPYVLGTRSGILIKGKFRWVKKCFIETKYVILDWEAKKCNFLFSGNFWPKVAKFLFQ